MRENCGGEQMELARAVNSLNRAVSVSYGRDFDSRRSRALVEWVFGGKRFRFYAGRVLGQFISEGCAILGWSRRILAMTSGRYLPLYPDLRRTTTEFE